MDWFFDSHNEVSRVPTIHYEGPRVSQIHSDSGAAHLDKRMSELIESRVIPSHKHR